MELIASNDWQGQWLPSMGLMAADVPRPAVPGASDGSALEDPDLEGKRVLVVEDDRAIRQVLTGLLEDAGYAVDASENGARALERLRSGPRADLIILDLRMPVMDGWQFRVTQRSDPTLASIPVLAISADGSAQAQAVDAAAYLHKPLRADDVLTAVSRILRQSEHLQTAERLAEADRLAAVGRLAAGVGHEINNPLTYVSLNVNYLVGRLRAMGIDEAERVTQIDNLEQMLGDAQFGLERIREIVDNLQGLSRRSELKLDGVCLEALLDRVLAMAEHQLRPRARLVKRYGGVPPLTANPGALSQLFLNLLANAAQSIEEGRVAENEVTVTTWTEGSTAVVEVADTGCGIPATLMPRIFDPFFTTKPEGEGTGLGLAISKRIVDEHGGQIEIESPGGRGTTVRVRLPDAPDRMMEKPDRFEGRPPEVPARYRVLVIDDEPRIGTIVARSLAPNGEVVMASAAGEALAHLARGERFDLILCNVIMPHGGGREMLEGLQATAPELVARLAFTTGGAFTPQSRRLVEGSRRPVLRKPFAPDDVLRLVESLGPARQN